VAPRLSFFFAVGLNFFEEIAKLRAARRLWARMVKAKFAPQKESSLILRWGQGAVQRQAVACAQLRRQHKDRRRSVPLG